MKKIVIAILLVFLPMITCYAGDLNMVKIRPHGGVSISNTNDEILNHIGGRVLLPTGGNKAYGLEITRFSSINESSVWSTGIILEQKLFHWFSMSIGTIGYFGNKNFDKTTAGLSTGLGWEPSKFKTVVPFVIYKTDFIFSEEFTQIQSISLGVSWN